MNKPNFIWTKKGIINLQFISLIKEERDEKGERIAVIHTAEGESSRNLVLTGKDAESFLALIGCYCFPPTIGGDNG